MATTRRRRARRRSTPTDRPRALLTFGLLLAVLVGFGALAGDFGPVGVVAALVALVLLVVGLVVGRLVIGAAGRRGQPGR